jgi:hypothetical protein
MSDLWGGRGTDAINQFAVGNNPNTAVRKVWPLDGARHLRTVHRLQGQGMGEERTGDEMTESTVFASGVLQFVFDTDETRVEFVRTNYATGGLAVLARNAETHEPIAQMSANFEGETLPPDEFYLRDWSENTEIAQLLILTGAIQPVANAEPMEMNHGIAYRWRIIG